MNITGEILADAGLYMLELMLHINNNVRSILKICLVIRFFSIYLPPVCIINCIKKDAIYI